MDRTEFIAEYVTAEPFYDEERVSKALAKAFTPDKDNENLVVVMEELAELQQEVAKAFRRKLDFYGLIEEMADVCIVLKVLQQIYHVSNEDLSRAINAKVDRLENGHKLFGNDKASVTHG